MHWLGAGKKGYIFTYSFILALTCLNLVAPIEKANAATAAITVTSPSNGSVSATTGATTASGLSEP